MALDHTVITTAQNTPSPRTTGPLRPTLDHCTMIVQTGGQLETVRAPGINLEGYSPRFAQGYAWGRDCFYSEVDDAVNADGTLYEGDGYTESQLRSGAVRFEKVKDLRPGTIAQLIREVIEDRAGLYDDCPFIERVGAIVGYIATCVEDYYGLTCVPCGKPRDLCSCQQPGKVTILQGRGLDL